MMTNLLYVLMSIGSRYSLWLAGAIEASDSGTGKGNVGTNEIITYFTNLFNQGIAPVVYAIATFFFGWAAIELMLPGERSQERAKAALYRALAGVVLVVLATAITLIFKFAKEGN